MTSTHPLHTWSEAISAILRALWITRGPGPQARIPDVTRLSLTEAQANLSKLVESAVTTHERFELIRNGERAAVLLGADDYDSLLETLDILSNPDEVEAIQTGLADVERGQLNSADEVRATLTNDGA